MATDKSNVGLRATLGQVSRNKGGPHGGVPIGNKKLSGVPSAGSSGNPGTEFPWDGADATDIGATTPLPPLKSL